MLIAKLTFEDEEAVAIGLTDKNIERLQKGAAITLQPSETGLNGAITFFHAPGGDIAQAARFMEICNERGAPEDVVESGRTQVDAELAREPDPETRH